MTRHTWPVFVLLLVGGPATVTYRLPLGGVPQVVRPFSLPASTYGPGHRGVDLAAPPGSPVLAATAGVVVYAGPLGDRVTVSLRHQDGIRTTYEPLTSLRVKRGQTVGVGAVLGLLTGGHPGCPVAACLHWGAIGPAGYLDPLTLLPPVPVRLLPTLPWSAAAP